MENKKIMELGGEETIEELEKEIDDDLEVIMSSSGRINSFLKGMFYMAKMINSEEGYQAVQSFEGTVSNISCYASKIRENLKKIKELKQKDANLNGGGK